MPLVLFYKGNAAGFYLLLNPERCRALFAGTGNLVFHHVESVAKRVTRIGQFANPPGPGPTEDQGDLITGFLEFVHNGQSVGYTGLVRPCLPTRQNQNRHFFHIHQPLNARVPSPRRSRGEWVTLRHTLSETQVQGPGTMRPKQEGGAPWVRKRIPVGRSWCPPACS